MFTFVVLCSFNLPNLITLKIIFPDPFQIFYSDCVPGFPYSRPCLFWAENLTFQFNKNLHIRLDFSVNTVSSQDLSVISLSLSLPFLSPQRLIIPLDHDPAPPRSYSSHWLCGVVPSIIHCYLSASSITSYVKI